MGKERLMETKRLHIRELCLDDSSFIIELLNQASFIRNIGDKMVRTQADAIKYLNEGPMASYKRHGFGLNAVLIKGSTTPIGMCGLLKRDELSNPDLGYAFLPTFCGQGYALEAATAVLHDGKTRHGLSTVLAVTLPDNLRSQALLIKLGFHLKEQIDLYNSANNLFECHL
jgi:RimJ/RimL family protein N-acetyltransferase